MSIESLIRPPLRDWARRAVRRVAARVPRLGPERSRRLLLVQLDGVPRAVLDRALAGGELPFLSSLLASSRYRLEPAFWGSPASTPVFQASLLYGARHPNIPAYRWFDRELGRVVRMNAPVDATAVEARLASAERRSLVSGGGTTYLSLLQAGASNLLSMPALARKSALAASIGRSLSAVRHASRRGLWGQLSRFAREAFVTARDVVRWVGHLGDWRHEAEYFVNRAVAMSLGWSLSHASALADMVRGVPVVFLVFSNFDEVGHRRGPESLQARAELCRFDEELEELLAFSHAVEHPYDLVLVTDHGQVETTPFESRHGCDLARYLLGGEPARLPPGLAEALLEGRPAVGRLPLGQGEEPLVVEAGNYAHVYLTRERRPLEARDLLQRSSAVLARATTHRDIGLVGLRLKGEGVAVVNGRVYRASELSTAPLAGEFSPRAVADFLNELPHLPTAGDLVLFGEVLAPGRTVGFTWDFGSHGSLTRAETDSLVLWPTQSRLELDGLSHASTLHERLSALYRA